MNREIDLTEKSSVEEAWYKLLQDVEIGKQYKVVYQLDGTPLPNPLLERMVASRLIIDLASVLDDFLEVFRLQKAVEYPKGVKRDLNGRIVTLSNRLDDPKALHGIRRRRNDLAHKPGMYGDWGELAEGLDVVHKEFLKYGWETDRPAYEFVAERSGAQASPDPAAVWEWEYTYGLKDDAGWMVGTVMTSTKKVMRSSDRTFARRGTAAPSLAAFLVFAPPGVPLNPRHKESAVVPNRWQDIIVPVRIEY